MSEPQVLAPLEKTAMETVAGGTAADSEASAAAAADKASAVWDTLKWLCSFPAMLTTFLVGRVFYEARNFIIDPDFWWHLRVGRDILATHRFPTADVFSYTAKGTPWIAYEWLGEVALAGVWKLGGLFAMASLRFVLIAVVVLALYYLGTLRSGNCKAGFVPAGLLCSLVLLSFTLRPQMFGYLFLVVTLIVLEKFRQGVTWPIWVLPGIFLLWVNIHGSFIVGIGVMVVYLLAGVRSFELGGVQAIAWTQKQRIQLEAALLFSLAVLPITPYGTQLAVYPFDMMFRQPINVAWMLEWSPMPFDQIGGKLFLVVVALLVCLQFLFRFTWRLEEFLLVVGGTVMTCLHVRMLLVFIPFVVPVFAAIVARWTPAYDKAKEHYALNGLLIAGVVAAMIHYVPTSKNLEDSVSANFPVAAVAYVDSHGVLQPMLANYGFGGFLVSREHPVFIDGRGDLFERAGVLSDYVMLTHLRPGALSVLDRYGIASCMLQKNDPLSVVLAGSPKWKQVYTDGTATVFVRVSRL